MKYTQMKDKELWERCRWDDERAYGELFKRYAARMLAVAGNYVKDPMTAEELVMDCFFRLWDRRRQIDIEGDFADYLFGCVYHSVVGHLRKKVPVLVSLEQVENAPGADLATDGPLLSEELDRTYRAALEKLSPRRREVFVLSRHENLTYPEIARKMNLSVGAVENYMVAALDSLRVNMAGCISALAAIVVSLF